MPGGDVGAKIMACDRELGAGGGTITHEGGGTVSTVITTSPGRVLRLGRGTYVNAFGPAPFRLNSDTTIEGVGAATVLTQFATPSHEVFFYVIIPANSLSTGGEALGTPSRNINVRNLTVDGTAGTGAGAAASAVWLGNCKNCVVENVHFRNIRAIGVQAGSTSTGGPDPEGLGRWAENVWIRNNTFEGCQSQQAAVVNGRNIYITGNRFTRANSSKQSQTVIDVEPNQPTDKNESIFITDNVIDNRDGTFNGGVNGIGVQGVSGTTARNVVVSGNRVIGGPHSNQSKLTIGIFVAGTTENVRVERNEVTGANASAYRFYATGAHRGAVLRGNTSLNSGAGGGSNYAVEIGACESCVVEDNAAHCAAGVQCNAQVVESGRSSVIYRRNTLRGGWTPGITKGASSRESGTIF